MGRHAKQRASFDMTCRRAQVESLRTGRAWGMELRRWRLEERLSGPLGWRQKNFSFNDFLPQTSNRKRYFLPFSPWSFPAVFSIRIPKLGTRPKDKLPKSLVATEKLGILSASGKSIIPEVAKRLSGIQKNNTSLDTGSRLRLVRYDVWGRFSDFFRSLQVHTVHLPCLS